MPCVAAQEPVARLQWRLGPPVPFGHPLPGRRRAGAALDEPGQVCEHHRASSLWCRARVEDGDGRHAVLHEQDVGDGLRDGRDVDASQAHRLPVAELVDGDSVARSAVAATSEVNGGVTTVGALEAVQLRRAGPHGDGAPAAAELGGPYTGAGAGFAVRHHPVGPASQLPPGAVGGEPSDTGTGHSQGGGLSRGDDAVLACGEGTKAGRKHEGLGHGRRLAAPACHVRGMWITQVDAPGRGL